MSERQPIPNESDRNILNTNLNRRQFLVGAGLAVGATLLNKYAPVEAASPEVAEAAFPSAWPEAMPVVNNEIVTAVETITREPLQSILPTLRKVTSDSMNVRAEPGIDKQDIGDFKSGNLLKIIRDEADPDTNDWGRVVQLTSATDPETGEISLQEGLEGSVALNLTEEVQPDAEGNILFTDANGEVAVSLTTNVIKAETTEPEALPISMSEFAAAEFPNIFQNIGGIAETDSLIAKMWNSEQLSSDKSIIDAWKRAISMAALTTPLDQEQETGNVNICELVGESNLSPCNFYRVVNSETGHIDVISRLSNRGDEQNPDLFIIARVNNGEQTSEQKVTGVGFASNAGFQVAYGERAEEIAHSVTAIAGDQVVDLVQGITEIEQMKVFLPGMDAKDQFVSQVPPLERKFRTLYLGEGISPSKTWEYKRTNAGYKAELKAIDRTQQDKEIIVRQSLYVPNVNNEQGEWVNLPEKEILDAGITRYAAALEFTGQEEDIKTRLEPRYINANGFTLVEMYDPETGIPVMDGKKEAGKEVKYTVGMRSLVEASRVHLGFSFPPGESGETGPMIFNEGDSITPLFFAHAQLSPSEDVLIDPNRKEAVDLWFKYAKEYNFRVTPGNYLAYAENFADWLKNSNKSPSEMMDYHKKWNSNMITSFPEAEGWYFNELLGVYNGIDLFNNKVFGGEMEPITANHYAEMEELFMNAQEAAKIVESQTGKKPLIGLNDYVGNVTQGADGNPIRDNAVTGPKTDLMLQVATYLKGKGLLDKVGIQYGFDNEGAPSSQDIEKSVKPFIDAGIPVEITEMMGLFKPEEWEMMVSTLLRSGVSSINIYKINGEKQLFQDSEPTADYYAVRKAYSGFVFGQS